VKSLILVAILVLEIVFFTAVAGQPLDAAYFEGLLVQSAPILLLAAGMTAVLLTKGIDLSVGSMTALVACAMASFDPGWKFWLEALPVGLVVALLAGLANGLLVAFVEMPPIIATLGTLILFRGICFVLMGDAEKGPFLDTPGYGWLGEPVAALLLVALVYGAGGAYFQRSRWRRELLLLGGNRAAARYAGVPFRRRLVEVYALTGLLAFLAALAYTGRNGSVSPSALTGLELKVIVAVVLGGTRVEGGAGSLAGTFLGVFIIAVMDEGLRGAKRWGDAHLPFEVGHLRFITLGALLAAGVWLNARFDRRSRLSG
jgi:ribose/xylose/arabinose/galactoside ABC-type transport system permease subunit